MKTQKYYNVTSGSNCYGRISFSGAVGYIITELENGTKTFFLEYSSEAIRGVYDLTDELKEALESHFSNKE